MARDETRDTCVYCAKFSIAGRPDLAAEGKGWCDTWLEPKPWDGQIGVLFIEARNRAARQRFVDRIHEPKPQPAEAA